MDLPGANRAVATHANRFEPAALGRELHMSQSKTLRVLITGAASGLGMQAARQLAGKGYHVIVADRNVAEGEAAVRGIRESGGSADFRALDLASLASIRRFAVDELQSEKQLDAMINNAGLLPPMVRTTTVDGFELAFGVAHLGHFALTALLLPALLRSASPRVVSVTSNSHSSGRIDLANLQLERGYSASRAYTNSKLACLLFAFELQRRASQANCALISVAVHPGFSTTTIAAGWNAENRRKLMDRFEVWGYRVCMWALGQDAADGARSLVEAASGSNITPGGYYGPTSLFQTKGPPGPVKPGARALDLKMAARLWEESETLTGVCWGSLSTEQGLSEP